MLHITEINHLKQFFYIQQISFLFVKSQNLGIFFKNIKYQSLWYFQLLLGYSSRFKALLSSPSKLFGFSKAASTSFCSSLTLLYRQARTMNRPISTNISPANRKNSYACKKQNIAAIKIGFTFYTNLKILIKKDIFKKEKNVLDLNALALRH